MIVPRDWLTVVSVCVLIALVGGFFGAVHPAFDWMGTMRPALGALLAVCAFFQVIRGHHLTALYIGVVAIFSLMTILGHASVDKPMKAADITMMQVNVDWDNRLHEMFLNRLERVQPDIVAMQQISDENRDIADTLALRYPYSAVCAFGDSGSVAIYSQYPYAVGSMPHCDEGWGYVIVPLQTPSGIVNAGSIHVQGGLLSNDAAQSARLVEYLSQNSGRYLIAGDFANAAWSHRVREIANAANTAPAPGVARTSGALMGLLGFRLNHVLVPQGWQSDTAVIDVPGTEADAVVAEIFVN